MADFLETFSYGNETLMMTSGWSRILNTDAYDLTFAGSVLNMSADSGHTHPSKNFVKGLPGMWTGTGTFGSIQFSFSGASLSESSSVGFNMSDAALTGGVFISAQMGEDAGGPSLFVVNAYVTGAVGFHLMASEEFVDTSGSPLWLRTLRVGDNILLQTSSDGTSYSNLGTSAPMPTEDITLIQMSLESDITSADNIELYLDNLALELSGSAGPTYYTPNIAGAFTGQSQTFSPRS
jgi:hypothetical protein